MIDFSDGLQMFAAKGTAPDDPIEVIRAPGDTRPLGLKNTDNKTIAGVTNNAMKHPIAKSANKLQNGFVVGRTFLNNVTLLDTTARGYSMCCPQLRPIIALFDFIAAFPSVLHEWLFLILDVCELSVGMFSICTSMYWLAQGVGRLCGLQTMFLYWIWSGVLQGCPLSGSLFVLAIDPFLDRFYRNVNISSASHRGPGVPRSASPKSPNAAHTIHNNQSLQAVES